MRFSLFLAALMLVSNSGCHEKRLQADSKELKGTVIIDGSSTVFPISEAMAEEFQKLHRGVRVTVGSSGTGGGFKKFLAGEIDICDASRPITADEKKKAQTTKVDFIELAVAIDGLVVVVSKDNPLKEISMAQLKAIWEPNSKIKTWKDFDSAFKNNPIKLFGPGADSGTFDYFTEAVVGKARASRSDYTSSEDDNVLVRGVAGNKDALAYFGHAYLNANAERIRALAVKPDEKTAAVLPEEAAIREGKYPLSRPLFIYVNKKAMSNPVVKAFVDFYLEKAPQLVPQVGYINYDDSHHKQISAAWKKWLKS